MRTEIRTLPSLLLLGLTVPTLAAAAFTDARAASPRAAAPQEPTIAIPERAFAVDVVQNSQDFFSEGEVTQDRVPHVIEKILKHLDANAPEPEATRRPPCRARPQRGLFDETG